MDEPRQSSWQTVTLGSLGDFRNGVNFSKGQMGHGLRLINVKDIFSSGVFLDFDKLDRVDLSERRGIDNFAVHENDLFFARSSVKRDGIGLVTLARRSDPKAIHCGFVIRLRLTSQVADPVFLAYLLRSPIYRQHIINVSGGAAITNISQGNLAELRVFLPPLPTQRKIADILSAYDDLIENNTRRIKILEEMAQMIYREWFVHFRFPGHEQVEMVETELGLAPEGWEIKQLGDFAQEMRRSVQPNQVDPDTPYLGLEHFPRKSIALSEWGAARDVVSTKLAFKEGEILFGKIRPYFHKVGVAPVDGVCSSDTIVIVPRQPEFFGLTLACVSSTDFVDQATLTSKGTKMPRADWSVLTKYPLAKPPSDLLSKFDYMVRDYVALIQSLMFRNRNLRHTRDLLLPKLVSGEVKVDQERLL